MRTFNCVFCGEDVNTRFEINDPTAKAICDGCYSRGGRLPGGIWQISVDDRGNPRTEGKAPLFSRYIHEQLAIGIAVAFFSVLIISSLFTKPLLGILLVLIMYALAVLCARYPYFTHTRFPKRK